MSVSKEKNNNNSLFEKMYVQYNNVIVNRLKSRLQMTEKVKKKHTYISLYFNVTLLYTESDRFYRKIFKNK